MEIINIIERLNFEKEDKHLTAISNAYKRKIKTERVICVTPDYNDLKVKPIVKVTLLD